MKPIIIFYKLRSDIEGIEGERLSKSLHVVDFERLLTAFEHGEVPCLLVSAGLVTGWCTRLYADEVDIWFLGIGWDEAEMLQAQSRAIPRTRRIKPNVIRTTFRQRKPATL